MLGKQAPYILSLNNIKDKDFELVGREALVYSYIYKAGIPVTPGFVLTTVSFDDFLTAGDLIQPISQALRSVRPFINQTARDASARITNVILSTKLPMIIERPLIEAYRNLNSLGDLPLAQIEISNIMDEKFVPNANLLASGTKNIFGAEALLYHVKTAWLNLFTTEAIEHRVNNYYSGPLTLAVMVKKAIRGELTGKSYNFTPGARDRNVFTIKSIYGMDLSAVEFEQFCDDYKVDISKKKIVEKFVKPQREMFVRKGKFTANEDPNVRVKISESWQARQKVSEDRIVNIAQITSKLSELYDAPIEISWAIDSGDVYVVDVRTVNKDDYKVSEEYVKKITQIEKPEEIEKVEEEKPDLVKLTKEVQDIVEGKTPAPVENEENEYFEEEQPKREITLTELRKRTQLTDANPKWFEKYSLKTDIYLDLSKVTSARIAAIENFSGAYFDGTEMILNNNVLPEQYSDNPAKLGELAERYALDVSSGAKTVGNKPFMYSFSNITDYERKLLGVEEGTHRFIGDERFIDSPEALATEVIAIKKARNFFGCKNITVTIPSIRNMSNLHDIKKILSAQGLKNTHYLKMYAEVSVPSFLFELNKLEKNDVDGLVLDLRSLLTLSVYRKEARDADYDALVEQFKFVQKIAESKKLELYIKLDSYPEKLIEEIIDLRPNGLIFENIPEEKIIALIKKKESK